MARDLEALAGALLDAAARAGADAADALVVEGTSLSIDVRNGTLERAERAEGIDLGLRVLMGRRQACVSASDSRPETLAEMAGRAVAMAREAPGDPHAGLAEPAALAPAGARDAGALHLADPAPEPGPAELEEAARRAEAAALAVPGVSRMDGAGAGYSARRLHLAASNGFSGGYARTGSGLSAVAISGEGIAMERDYDGDYRTHRADLRSAEEIGRIAGERAAARAGARKPPTGAFPVLFDERVAGSLVGHLLAAINGSAVARGASWLRDAMGDRVLPPGLSLIEEPRRPRSTSGRPFDAEGLPTGTRALVEAGVLRSWVLDLATARKLGLSSTANAARGPSGPPSPSAGNIRLTSGSASPEELMREMGTGLLVTSLIGSSINPTTGDYSRGASGVWIENGAPAYPVNECTVAGNLREMLGGLVPANDARESRSRIVPSLLVEGLTLAGG